MDHPARVGRGQPVGEAAPERHHLVRRQRDALGQRPTAEVLHREVRPAVRRRTGRVHGDDVGVGAQGPDRAALLGEAALQVVHGRVGQQDLDRGRAVEGELARAVHDAETAAPDLGLDLEAVDLDVHLVPSSRRE